MFYPHVCVPCVPRAEEGIRSYETELWMVVSCYVGAWDQTQFFWINSLSSALNFSIIIIIIIGIISVCTCVYVSVYVCLSMCMCLCVCLCMSVSVFVYMSVHVSVCAFVSLCICLSMCLCVCVSLCMSVYLLCLCARAHDWGAIPWQACWGQRTTLSIWFSPSTFSWVNRLCNMHCICSCWAIRPAQLCLCISGTSRVASSSLYRREQPSVSNPIAFIFQVLGLQACVITPGHKHYHVWKMKYRQMLYHWL